MSERARVTDEDRGLIRTSLAWLLALGDPLSDDPWGVGPITVADVREHRPDAAPEHDCIGEPGVYCRGCEISRIAHLAEHGWPPADADPHPITIDVGLGDYLPNWPLVDGNHRVAAAVVRGQEWTEVSISGDWDRAVALFVHGRRLDEVLDGLLDEMDRPAFFTEHPDAGSAAA